MQRHNEVSRLTERCGTRNVSGHWQTVLVNSPYSAKSAPRSGGGYVCSCCLRPWDECVADTGRSDGQARQRTCPPCHDHGPNMMAASRVHAELWQALARSRQLERDAAEALLRSQVAELEQELHDRPKQIVERYLDRDQLEAAREEADRAFRSRENAWQALCMVRLIHREGQPGQCRCGLHLDRCNTAQIVDHYPGLEKWEREQVSRLRRHLRTRTAGGPPGTPRSPLGTLA